MTKKNAVVALGNTSERAAIEARRGIVRDAEGRIIRTPEWRKERIQALKVKRADYQQRIKNIDAELKALTK